MSGRGGLCRPGARVDLVLARLALGGLGIITVVGLAVLAGSSAGQLSRPRLSAAILAVAVVWLLLNGATEGRTLFALDHRHGVTVADLASLPALVVAAALHL